MSFSGGNRSWSLLHSFFVVLLIISLLHIWAFNDYKVVALRILIQEKETLSSSDSKRLMTDDHGKINGVRKISTKAEQFRRFFNGKASPNSDLNTNHNRTDKGFQDNKRRVPSCPDPLHNK